MDIITVPGEIKKWSERSQMGKRQMCFWYLLLVPSLTANGLVQ